MVALNNHHINWFFLTYLQLIVWFKYDSLIAVKAYGVILTL